MDSPIHLGIEIIDTINAISTLIIKLRSTPDAIQQIRSQFGQLKSLLDILHRKSQLHIISDADMKDWLEHERICNTTQHKIETLIEDYAKGSTGKVPIMGVVKFQLGPKQELLGLLEDLKSSVQLFMSFAQLALSGA